MPTRGRNRIAGLAICCLVPLAAAASGRSATAEAPPSPREVLRAQAVETLAGGEPSLACLTPLLQTLRQDPSRAPAAARKAFFQLQSELTLPGDRRFVGRDGTVVRDPFEGASGRPFPQGDAGEETEAIDAVLLGIADARKLLGEEMGLPAPAPLEVVLERLGPGLDGYLLPTLRRDGRAIAVLDATPGKDLPALRRAAAHQYAHAVALAAGPELTPAFGEALAAWTSLRLAGGPDAAAAVTLSARLGRLGEGLAVDDPRLAAGNAAFLAFLDEAYGPTAVGLAVQELATGAPVPLALDRAMRRGAGTTLADAFRSYQIWCHFVGERSDGLHFSFADRLAAPPIPMRFDGLPALSVLEEPPVGPLGAASILLHPDREDGGMIVRVEGDPSGSWEADLLLFDDARRARRVPIALASDGTGETTVPLQSVSEAVLLVRNLGAEDGAPLRYSWSAFLDRAFPFEVGTAGARRIPGGGVLVSWETLSERSLAGFRVLRREETAAGWSRVSPVWIPPMGDGATPASYGFIDATAPEDTPLLYRIEGVTSDGLSGFSDSFAIAAQERP